MPVWDPARYLQFADDRSRPFVDLVGRVRGTPSTIVDLGCGPGRAHGDPAGALARRTDPRRRLVARDDPAGQPRQHRSWCS
ncbi:hypothetical protein ACHMWU_12000 [Aeromicrobium sp. UC242_57]